MSYDQNQSYKGMIYISESVVEEELMMRRIIILLLARLLVFQLDLGGLKHPGSATWLI